MIDSRSRRVAHAAVAGRAATLLGAVALGCLAAASAARSSTAAPERAAAAAPAAAGGAAVTVTLVRWPYT